MISKIGGFLAIIGLFSTILSFTNYEVRILGWIETWGTTTAWIIRIGLIVVGAILYVVGAGKDAEVNDEVPVNTEE